jgi:hypothetical protein
LLIHLIFVLSFASRFDLSWFAIDPRFDAQRLVEHSASLAAAKAASQEVDRRGIFFSKEKSKNVVTWPKSHSPLMSFDILD